MYAERERKRERERTQQREKSRGAISLAEQISSFDEARVALVNLEFVERLDHHLHLLARIARISEEPVSVRRAHMPVPNSTTMLAARACTEAGSNTTHRVSCAIAAVFTGDICGTQIPRTRAPRK